MASIIRFFRWPALNQEATEALVASCRSVAELQAVETVDAEWCFNVEVDAGAPPLDEHALGVLRWLFAETFEPDQTATASSFPAGVSSSPSSAVVVEVGPRMAFSTAWSSNAVSIAHACGLQDVIRIERSRRYLIKLAAPPSQEGDGHQTVATAFAPLVHDRMTECVYKVPIESFAPTGEDAVPEPVFTVPVMAEGLPALERVNASMGLGFDAQDLKYYLDLFVNSLKRDPTNVEIYDMAQSNSEHSRHWFFGGRQVIDGQEMPTTLFKMVKATCPKVKKDGVTPSNSVIAFHDNSSSLAAPAPVAILTPTTAGGPSSFAVQSTLLHPILTAETHNFPCAVAPFPGAETGTGGRLRDVQATGRGAHTMAGVSAYCFGQLLLPDYELPWEDASAPYPAHLAHPRTIAVEASNGASDYGNKYGEPVLAGFCRSFGMKVPSTTKAAKEERVEWIKPIMFTAGVGQMDARHATKGHPQPGMLVVKIGGPAYRIGLGGGAASSRVNDAASAALDFNAVQRGDAEMENRMNRLVRACVEMGAANPIVSIHDQGCGGNGNVLKEIVEEQGAAYDIRKVLVGDPTLSVMEIWGAEYQENNALLLHPSNEQIFTALCTRENCPFSVVGTVSGDGRVKVEDSSDIGGGVAVDLPLSLVLGDLPPKVFYSDRAPRPMVPLTLPDGTTVASCLDRVLRLPSVASKRWLVHKVDRSVTGLVAQQQCVGPLQLPLANCAVLAQSHFTRQGIATAVGEQPIKGLLSPAAMARLTVAEMLTNLMWARVTSLEDVKCSGNWMWAAKLPGEGARMWDCCEALRDAVMELGVGIDGGKDSLSMAAGVGSDVVKAPGTLTLTAYASVTDVALTVTPNLKQPGASSLLMVDLGPKNALGRLGGTALAHCFGQLGEATPDLSSEDGSLGQLAQLFNAVQGLLDRELILAGHDRSDGGLATTLLEMAFSGNCGLDVDLTPSDKSRSSAAADKDVSPALAMLFNEEVGVVMEVGDQHLAAVVAALEGLPVSIIGRTTVAKQAKFTFNGEVVLDASVVDLRDTWEATSFELEKRQRLPSCAEAEQKSLAHRNGPSYKVPFAASFVDPVVGLPPQKDATYPYPGSVSGASKDTAPKKHKVAVLRQEGSNGDREMAAAFAAAGLEAWDLTVSDLLEGRAQLSDFKGLVFVGGFSYADVLDSGKGWAAVIKYNPLVLAQFNAFRERKDTFSLGVCNGCQFLALLGWIPQLDQGKENGGAMSDATQPRFVHNASGKFESRWVTLGIEGGNPAVLLKGMEGSKLGCWIAHGEGKAHFPTPQVMQDVLAKGLAPIRYVDDDNNATVEYPYNPNGSPEGIAALCSPDGRHLAMMPHPERCFLKWQWPWMDAEVAAAGPGDAAPWLYLFQNAKRFCDATV